MTEYSTWEFAQFALQRNDEAIKFAEFKAGFILSFISLFISGIFDNIDYLQSVAKNCCQPNCYFLLSGIGLCITGIIIAVVTTISVIFPRFHVVKRISYLYFNDNYNLHEEDIRLNISKLHQDEMLSHLIAQVHASSIIAHDKFILIRFSIIGLILLFIGVILTVIGFSLP